MLETHLLHPSRLIVKNYLSEYTKNPLKVGSNFIKVEKILEKWVTFAESRNDLVETQKKVPLKDSIIYFEYKKELLNNTKIINDDLVDPSTQNKQYQLQFENYQEAFINVMNVLTIIWKKHSKNFSFNLTDDKLSIEFSGYKVELCTNNDFNTFTLQTDFSIKQIDTQLTHTFLSAYNETSKLLFYNTDVEFTNDFGSMFLYKKQLKLLVSFVHTENLSAEDLEIQNKIKHFIMYSKKGHSLELDYESLNLNGSIFTRKFKVVKLTKIRTVVSVIATCGDIELIEYEKTFTKVNHQIEHHTNEIQKLYLANK